METKKYIGEPSLLRPPSKDFQCQERILTEKEIGDDDDYYEDYGSASTVVAFECTVAQQQQSTPSTTLPSLVFWCREPSCGVLVNDEAAAIKEDDGAVDPSFFDPGYTMAGRTGFQVWPGSRLMVEALAFTTATSTPEDGYQDLPALQKWQQLLLLGHTTSCTTTSTNNRRPLRILELGAGVGVVGASLAAASAGAEVLMTDLPTLVTESLQPNLERNATTARSTDTKEIESETSRLSSSPPSWLLSPTEPPTKASNDDESSTYVPMPVQIGNGWVAAAALDWTKPVFDEQLTREQCQVDLVIACDCVWLVSMLDGLLNSVQAIFEAATTEENKPTLLMSFQRRDPSDGNESHMFTTVDRVIHEIRHVRKWSLTCLAWQPVVYTEEDEEGDSSGVGNGNNDKSVKTTKKEVFLFEISPP